jgi:hypothetical protein
LLVDHGSFFLLGLDGATAIRQRRYVLAF